MKKAIFIMFAVLILAGIGWGMTSDGIYIEGRLMKDGKPTTETVRVTAKVYEVDASSASWQRTFTSVPVRDGHFSLRLAWSDPIPRNLIWHLDWLKEYEVELTIADQVFPRQRLVAVPYALMTKRVHGGVVDAGSLKAVYPGTTSVEAAISWTTSEAVSGTIGGMATGEIGSLDWRAEIFYGIDASGSDGSYVTSSGIGVWGRSAVSPEVWGTGFEATGPISLRVSGPIKINRHTTAAPAATGIVTMPPGAYSVTVTNPLVRAKRTLVFLSPLDTLENTFRVWIDGSVRDGSFTIRREIATYSRTVGYLLIN